MSEIETEVLKALDQKKQTKKEDRQDYLKRLVDAANAFWFPTDADGDETDSSEEANEAWETLTEAAQQWINAAVKVEDDDIPDFPDAETEDETETETKETEDMALRDDSNDDETLVKTKKTGKTASKGKAEKAPAKKVAAKATKGKEKPVVAKGKTAAKAEKGTSGRPAKRGNGVSGYTMIRSIMRKDTNMKLAALVSELEKKGYSLSTNATAVIRTNFLATIRELHEAGCIKGISMPD